MINTLDELFRALGRTRHYLENAPASTGTVTVNAPDLRIILDDRDEGVATVRRLRGALELALDYLREMEPSDSRAVSNEYVAMLGVLYSVEPNTPGEDMAIIKKALEARRARAALTGEDTATLSLSGKTQTDDRTRGDG